MFKHRSLLVAATGVFTFFACQSNTPTAPAASPLTVAMTQVKKENCIRDSVCATLDLTYPVLSGGNTSITAAINDSIKAFVYLVAGANPALPLPQALDSAALNMFVLLKEDLDLRDDHIGMSFSNGLTSKVLWQTNRYLSLDMSTYSFSGGAHGMYGTLLETFDLTSGKPLNLIDIIRDTVALRPLLEKGFVDAKKEEAPDLTLRDLLLPEFKNLPMPAMYCLVPEGVRFVYNPYEVAPYAVGQTEILLTWEQLGKLADKAKWQ